MKLLRTSFQSPVKRLAKPYIRRLHAWGARTFPYLVEHPQVRSLRQSEGYFTTSAHGDFYPLNDQGVELRQICAVDFFTPSSFAQVVRNLEKLGFRRNERDDSDTIEWIKNTRRHSMGGSWLNLGYIVRQRMGGYFRSTIVSKSLPKSFDGAQASLVSLTPSLSALVIIFDLSENRKLEFQSVALDHFSTKFKIKRRSISIVNPDHQRQDCIKLIRTRYQLEVANWFRVQFGSSLASSPKGVLPCMEVIETKSSRYPNRDKSLRSRILGMDEFRAWRDRTGSFSLLVDNRDRAYPVGVSSFHFSSDSVKTVDTKMYGNGPDAILSFLHFDLVAITSILGLNSYLGYLHRELADTRDDKWSPISGKSKGKGLDEIRRRWRRALDIKSISHELEIDSSVTFGTTLKLYAPYQGSDEYEFVQCIVDRIERDSKDLDHFSDIIVSLQRGLDVDYATLQSAASNRQTVILSYINAVLAIMAFAVASASMFIAWVAMDHVKAELIENMVAHLIGGGN